MGANAVIPSSKQQKYSERIYPADKIINHFREMIEELSRMQKSDDLFERYHSFTRLIEENMCEMLGPCTVSLWCPEMDGKT
ncbi:hypothetical protein JW979_15845, partial [bacterium]|nr:hypothetical protein [candidate division CSSED10-310 bacterium]